MNSSHSSDDNNSSGSQLINTQNFANTGQQQLNPNSVMHQINQLKLTLENLRNLENKEFQEEELKPGDNSQSNNLISQIKKFLKSSIKSNIKEQNTFINKYYEKGFWESLIEALFSVKKSPIEQISIDKFLEEQKAESKEKLLESLLKDFAQAAFYLENLVESYFNLQNQNNEYLKQLNQKDQQINQLNQKLQYQYLNVDQFEQELNEFQNYHEALNKDYEQSQRKIKLLENQLKQLEDKYSSLVLNYQKTIEHNQNLINQNNDLRSQILLLQIQSKRENLQLENISEKLETKRDNLNQGATPCENSSELSPSVVLKEMNQDSPVSQNGGTC